MWFNFEKLELNIVQWTVLAWVYVTDMMHAFKSLYQYNLKKHGIHLYLAGSHNWQPFVSTTRNWDLLPFLLENTEQVGLGWIESIGRTLIDVCHILVSRFKFRLQLDNPNTWMCFDLIVCLESFFNWMVNFHTRIKSFAACKPSHSTLYIQLHPSFHQL